MSTDTINVPIPRSVVETVQNGGSVAEVQQAARIAYDAVKAVELPAPALVSGSVYADPDGDLWVVGPNGKAGLVIIDADPDFGEGQQLVNFFHDSVPVGEDDGWSVIHVPDAEAVTEEAPELPAVVIDCEGDEWTRTEDGLYTHEGMGAWTYDDLAKDYPTGYGPLEVAS